MKFIFVSLALILFSLVAYTQTTPSVTTVDPAKPFVSVEGKFSIALPDQGAQQISWTPQIGEFAEGKGYKWTMSEAVFTVCFDDKPASLHRLGDREILESVRSNVEFLWRFNYHDKARDTADELKRFGPYLMREYRWSYDGLHTLMRSYMANDRLYEVTAVIPEAQKKQKSVVTKVLDGFKILSDKHIKLLPKK